MCLWGGEEAALTHETSACLPLPACLCAPPSPVIVDTIRIHHALEVVILYAITAKQWSPLDLISSLYLFKELCRLGGNSVSQFYAIVNK